MIHEPITEQVIKDALDGWFFTYRPATLETKAQKVAKDYMPAHNPPAFGIADKSKKWTAEEDAKIYSMFQAGFTFKQMGLELGVSGSAANVRWQQLCVTHGYSNKRRNLQETFSYETCCQVANMKLRQGMLLKDVAKKMGLTTSQALNLWRRWKEKNGFDEDAA